MSKIVVIVVMIAVMGMFFASCYLMTIVNPPPLNILDEKKKTNPTPTPNQTARRYEDNEDDLPSNPLESLTPFFRFSMAKLAASLNSTSVEEGVDALFEPPVETNKKVPLYSANNIPTIKTTTYNALHAMYTIIFTPTTEATIYEAIPSHNPLELPLSRTQIYKDSYTKENESLNTNQVSSIPNADIISLSTPGKGHRRSVKSFYNKVIDRNSNGFIMKILNKQGKPRIEIKVYAEDSSDVKEGLLEAGSELEIIVQKNNTRNEKGDLGYMTEIKILPNNTVMVDSDFDLLDGKSAINITKKASKPIRTFMKPNYKNRTTVNDDEINTTDTDATEKQFAYKPTTTVFPVRINMRADNINLDNIQGVFNNGETKINKFIVNKSDTRKGKNKNTNFMHLESNTNHHVDSISKINSSDSTRFSEIESTSPQIRPETKTTAFLELDKNMSNKSDLIGNTLFENFNNYSSYRVNSTITTSIYSNTEESMSGIGSKIKNDAKKDINIAKNEVKKIGATNSSNHQNIKNHVNYHVVTNQFITNTEKYELRLHSTTKTDFNKSRKNETELHITNKTLITESTSSPNLRNHVIQLLNVMHHTNNSNTGGITQTPSKIIKTNFNKDAEVNNQLYGQKGATNKSLQSKLEIRSKLPLKILDKQPKI